MKKTVALTLILLCIMTLGVVCVRPIKAQSLSGITINADGSVDPSTAPMTRMENVYTLTSNFYGSISVQRSNTTIDGNKYIAGAVSLYKVSNVTVKNFTVTGYTPQEMQGTLLGVLLTNTSTSIVKNNIIRGVESYEELNGVLCAGIYVKGGNSNIITENKLENNGIHVLFSETANNLITRNNVTISSNVKGMYRSGIVFQEASNNIIYYNNFRNSLGDFGRLAKVSDSINTWDNGYPFGGNYWSDYQTRYPNATEIGSSGMGNTPYFIDSQNKDQYPLMKPFNTATYLLQTTPPKISLRSPLNRTYNETSVSLVFSVDKVASWMGYSLDGEPNVTVTGNSTIANMTNGMHSITVYVNDTFGNLGTSETINFTISKPETQTFPTTIIIAVVGASTIIVIAGLLVIFKKRNLRRDELVKKP